MKLSLPLSFLLCLPAMAIADENSPGAALHRALQDQAVHAEAEPGQRQLGSKSSKSSKSSRRLGSGMALQDQAVDNEAEAGQRQLKTKAAKVMSVGAGRRLSCGKSGKGSKRRC